MWALVSFVLSQCTRLTDRRTDRRTERSWKYCALHYMQSHGKIVTIYLGLLVTIFEYILRSTKEVGLHGKVIHRDLNAYHHDRSMVVCYNDVVANHPSYVKRRKTY